MSPRILLADDSVTVQRVIELTFADEGMQVVAVGDGRQAIECLETDPPDIVLADVSMPERDGYAVAEHMKASASLRHIPVVLMTGAFEQLDEARARAAGCDGVLAKPFEPQMVIALVRELLAKSAAGMTPVAADAPVAAEAALAEAAPWDSGVQPPQAPPTLDDFFDRIDESAAAERPALADGDADTLISLPPAPAGSAMAPALAGAADAGSAPSVPGSPLADAFSAILADELGEAPLPASWAGFGPAPAPAVSPAPAAPALTDEFVDELTRRVAERLSHSVVRQVVDERVLDVAERLVREEIDRLKAGV